MSISIDIFEPNCVLILERSKYYMETRPKQDNTSTFRTRLKDRYLSFFNKHKSVAFMKNQVISGALFAIGGVTTAKATSLLTSSKPLIAGFSTAGEYVVGLPAFFILHYMDNKDLYRDTNGIKWKRAGVDFTKIMAETALLDAAYLIARPMLHYHFMKNGIDATTSALYADLAAQPAYWITALLWARYTGVLSPDNELKKA